MTLFELCEPLFQYICRLNRSARKGANIELGTVRSEIEGILASAKSAAVGQNLSEQYDKIELPLMFFCDFMIKESALPWAREWRELAFDRHEMAGDEKFFDLLEETIKDKTPSANDRLTVFYTCIGVGFTGWYTSQPEYLRRKMKEIAARLQAAGLFVDTQKICADAYEKVDTRDLIQPPATTLMGIGIILFGLIVVLLCTYWFLYHTDVQEIKSAFTQIDSNVKASGGS